MLDVRACVRACVGACLAATADRAKVCDGTFKRHPSICKLSPATSKTNHGQPGRGRATCEAVRSNWMTSEREARIHAVRSTHLHRWSVLVSSTPWVVSQRCTRVARQKKPIPRTLKAGLLAGNHRSWHARLYPVSNRRNNQRPADKLACCFRTAPIVYPSLSNMAPNIS